MVAPERTGEPANETEAGLVLVGVMFRLDPLLICMSFFVVVTFDNGLVLVFFRLDRPSCSPTLSLIGVDGFDTGLTTPWGEFGEVFTKVLLLLKGTTVILFVLSCGELFVLTILIVEVEPLAGGENELRN